MARHTPQVRLDLQRVTEQRDQLIATLEAIERAALDKRARHDGEDIARMARAAIGKVLIV
jgi:hypothetical protein